MSKQKKDFISVVLPCLNEEPTIAACVEKAIEGMKKAGVEGEVVVADNGSTDRSKEVAEKAGARVVDVNEKGYGAAIMGGIAKAKGNILVMGDADDTYDFRQIPVFYHYISRGFDFVSGNRLVADIADDAMPWLHRYIGVPALSWILNLFFRTGIRDCHCGFRMFTKEANDKMNLQGPGMEYASEMLMKAKIVGLQMVEVPIRYDARVNQEYSKLNTFRDGFRHLFLILGFAVGNYK